MILMPPTMISSWQTIHGEYRHSGISPKLSRHTFKPTVHRNVRRFSSNFSTACGSCSTRIRIDSSSMEVILPNWYSKFSLVPPAHFYSTRNVRDNRRYCQTRNEVHPRVPPVFGMNFSLEEACGAIQCTTRAWIARLVMVIKAFCSLAPKMFDSLQTCSATQTHV